MKKISTKFLAFLLALIMVSSLTACKKTEDSKGDKLSEVAGDYDIDLSALGMQLTVYLRINEDGSFKFSGKPDFEQDKNSGTVKKTETGYMMAYTVINNETVTGKTTKFTKEEDGRLKFDGTIYYGSTKPTSPMEDASGQTVYIYAVKHTGGADSESAALEIGAYTGVCETESKMGKTVYNYSLNLLEGGKFTAFVTFEMMGAQQYAYDYGTYNLMGAMCRMDSAVYTDKETNKPVVESVVASADGVKANVKISPMKKELVDIELTKAAGEPELLAEFTAEKEMSGMMGEGEWALTLAIFSNGSYKYTSVQKDDDKTTMEETGFIGLSAMGEAYLLPDGMTEGLMGTYDNETNTIGGLKFSLVSGTPRTEIEFTLGGGTAVNTAVEPGKYAGTCETESKMGKTVYNYTLDLREDGKFTSFVTFEMMGALQYSFDYGTYEINDSGVCEMLSEVYKDKETEEAVKETVTASEDGITANIKISPMKKDLVDVELTKSEKPAELIATFTAEQTLPAGMGGGGTWKLTLEVYADGSYKYTSIPDSEEEPSAAETGFIGLCAMGQAFLLPDGAEEGIEGMFDSEANTISGLTFSLVDKTPRTEITFTKVESEN